MTSEGDRDQPTVPHVTAALGIRGEYGEPFAWMRPSGREQWTRDKDEMSPWSARPLSARSGIDVLISVADPEDVSIALAHLPSDVVVDLLKDLSPATSVHLLERARRKRMVSPADVVAAEWRLLRIFGAVLATNRHSTVLTEIVQRTDNPADVAAIVAYASERDPSEALHLARHLRQMEDLLALPPDDLGVIASEADSMVLAMALKLSSPEVRTAFEQVVSPRVWASLAVEIDGLRLSRGQIRRSVRDVMELVDRLGTQGRIGLLAVPVPRPGLNAMLADPPDPEDDDHDDGPVAVARTIRTWLSATDPIARAAEEDEPDPRVIAGTLAAMPPEQLRTALVGAPAPVLRALGRLLDEEALGRVATVPMAVTGISQAEIAAARLAVLRKIDVHRRPIATVANVPGGVGVERSLVEAAKRSDPEIVARLLALESPTASAAVLRAMGPAAATPVIVALDALQPAALPEIASAWALEVDAADLRLVLDRALGTARSESILFEARAFPRWPRARFDWLEWHLDHGDAGRLTDLLGALTAEQAAAVIGGLPPGVAARVHALLPAHMRSAVLSALLAGGQLDARVDDRIRTRWIEVLWPGRTEAWHDYGGTAATARFLQGLDAGACPAEPFETLEARDPAAMTELLHALVTVESLAKLDRTELEAVLERADPPDIAWVLQQLNQDSRAAYMAALRPGRRRKVGDVTGVRRSQFWEDDAASRLLGTAWAMVDRGLLDRDRLLATAWRPWVQTAETDVAESPDPTAGPEADDGAGGEAVEPQP